MGTVKDTKKNLCDDVYTEFSGMKERLVAMRDDFARVYGTDTKIYGLFERHLNELVDQIDWKLQILSHACPYDWKGSGANEYEENTVSVGPAERMTTDFSGGYLGG